MLAMQETLFGEPDPVDRLVEALWGIKGWPQDYDADRELISRLRKRFPRMTPEDMAKAIEDWGIWLLDHPEIYKKPRNWRSRFRSWLEGGERFEFKRRERRAAGGGGRVGGTGRSTGPTSTRAGSAADFGETRRLDDW